MDKHHTEARSTSSLTRLIQGNSGLRSASASPTTSPNPEISSSVSSSSSSTSSPRNIQNSAASNSNNSSQTKIKSNLNFSYTVKDVEKSELSSALKNTDNFPKANDGESLYFSPQYGQQIDDEDYDPLEVSLSQDTHHAPINSPLKQKDHIDGKNPFDDNDRKPNTDNEVSLMNGLSISKEGKSVPMTSNESSSFTDSSVSTITYIPYNGRVVKKNSVSDAPIDFRRGSNASDFNCVSYSPFSSSIPYSAPYSGSKSQLITSPTQTTYESQGFSFPANGNIIDSNHILSPKVNDLNNIEIDQRFIVTKSKINYIHNSPSYHNGDSKSSSNGSISRNSSMASLSNFFKQSRKNSSSLTNMNNGGSYSYTAGASCTVTSANGNFNNSSPSELFNSDQPLPQPQSDGCASYDPPRSLKSRSSKHDLKKFFSRRKPGSNSDAISIGTKTNNSNSPNFNSNGNSYGSGSHSYNSPVSPSINIPNSKGSASNLYTNQSSSLNNNSVPHHEQQVLPFSKRYNKMSESLGAGAGGSVRIVKRVYDKKIFAVKDFRARFANESKKDYTKKITSEYCIGSTLKNTNIIETIEICYENDKIYQVMEYCEFDLFAIVMSGKMTSHEVDCCFKQILKGVRYLHSMGLAHRDLKLDNCCITEKGIVKIIDFGSSVVFTYPFSNKILEAGGIVGSDPYLAPEVVVFQKYDPRPVDIWSAAIIYSCMTLRKFPWKVPKLSDQSFKLFATRGDGTESLNSMLKKVREPVSTNGSALTDGKTDASSSKNDGNAEGSVTDDSKKDTPLTTPESSSSNAAPDYDKPLPSPRKSTSSPTKNHPPVDKDQGANPDALKSKSTSGEARLLKALPNYSRPLISKMVRLAPACRCTIEEIFEDEWLESIDECYEDDVEVAATGEKKLYEGANHTHTKVDQSEAHIAYLEKKRVRK